MVVESKNSTQVGAVREIYTDDTIAALNAALLERGVETDKIISVLSVPGQGMVRPASPQFRVLYRAN